ncbi:MAG: hypothetical protein IKD20_01560, partial [Clostridia bacterium]|nr:hypothetical protein [Clostridia bacterium]
NSPIIKMYLATPPDGIAMCENVARIYYITLFSKVNICVPLSTILVDKVPKTSLFATLLAGLVTTKKT